MQSILLHPLRYGALFFLLCDTDFARVQRSAAELLVAAD